jgi:superfamily I DNA/RNA helicase
MAKYRVLLTEGSFETLRRMKDPDREPVSSFLEYLMDGNWERTDPARFRAIVWRQINSERYLFSCEIREELYAIWEVLWSINMTGRLKISPYNEKSNGRDFCLHTILYTLGEFPGQPDSLLHVGTEDFEKVGFVGPRYLNFYDREPKEEIKYNEELYSLPRALIERVLMGEQRGLVLHMPEEQVDVLSAQRTLRGPILLSGEAGSGKTTVITHWLVIGELLKIGPQLFVTFSERLTEQARIEFEQMLPLDHGPHQVRFLTYRQLLLEVADAGGLEERDPSKEMTFERFLREYRNRVSPQVDPVLLWDEIRSVIKGRCEDPNKRMLDYSGYEMLSEERGQCKTPKRMREKYYEEAQKYQNYLDKEGLWDAIDLAFNSLQSCSKVQKYARLACDEVQDLAPVEIRVLINLVKNNDIDSMFFTGDMAQVINPSGFLWSRLKGDLGFISKRHDIMDPWTLKRNFRSTREIVDVVNKCLRVREDLLGDAGERNLQHSSVRGDVKPMVLRTSPVEQIKECVSNPQKRLILVKTNKVKNEIMELLEESREKATILTVEEAKGLEWEGALLWKFFIPRHEEITKNDWETVFIPEKRRAFKTRIEKEGENPYALAYEFNLLHVGLTRPRKFLFMYDEDQIKTILNLGENMEDLVTEIDNKQFAAYWATTMPNPGDLLILASNLETRDQEQALQFFKIAAREYEKAGKLEDAAKCFARAFEFKLASNCYSETGNVLMQERMLACDSDLLARRSESKGEIEGSRNHWKDAGQHWEKYCARCREVDRWNDLIEGYDLAKRAYSNAGLFRDAAMCLQRLAEEIPREKKENVIIKAKSLYDAAKCWEKAGSIKNAIEAINGAINTGRDEIIKSAETTLISGEIPEMWVAECFATLADYHARNGDSLSVAQASMDAAKYFSDAEEKVEKAEKEGCLERQLANLNKAAENYKVAGHMHEAIEVQKRSVDLSKERVDNYGSTRLGGVNRSWGQLINWLKEFNQTIKCTDESIEYVEYLGRVNEKETGIKVAETQIEWCEQKEPEGAIKLLNIVKGWYERNEEYRLAGKTIERIGKIQERTGDRKRAISSYIDAGRSYLMASSVDLALYEFNQGLIVTTSEASPSANLGYYCLKEVVLDSLIPKLFEENYRYQIVKEWTDKAANYFADDYKQSMLLIEELTKNLESRLGETPKGSLERRELLRKSGWAWLCLATLCQTVLKQNANLYQLEKTAEEAYEKSRSSFKILEDKELDDREAIAYILLKTKKSPST